ncbi:hypothetical protein CGZ60_06615 [Neisseria animalis]|nr:hypothetical protein CGZ60_06615 [Neisseria animalis]
MCSKPNTIETSTTANTAANSHKLTFSKVIAYSFHDYSSATCPTAYSFGQTQATFLPPPAEYSQSDTSSRIAGQAN